MGVGMCLYAQLVQTNNTWCKSAIIMRYHPYLSGFCSRLTRFLFKKIFLNHSDIYYLLILGYD